MYVHRFPIDKLDENFGELVHHQHVAAGGLDKMKSNLIMIIVDRLSPARSHTDRNDAIAFHLAGTT